MLLGLMNCDIPVYCLQLLPITISLCIDFSNLSSLILTKKIFIHCPK